MFPEGGACAIGFGATILMVPTDPNLSVAHAAQQLALNFLLLPSADHDAEADESQPFLVRCASLSLSLFLPCQAQTQKRLNAA